MLGGTRHGGSGQSGGRPFFLRPRQGREAGQWQKGSCPPATIQQGWGLGTDEGSREEPGRLMAFLLTTLRPPQQLRALWLVSHTPPFNGDLPPLASLPQQVKPFKLQQLPGDLALGSGPASRPVRPDTSLRSQGPPVRYLGFLTPSCIQGRDPALGSPLLPPLSLGPPKAAPPEQSSRGPAGVPVSYGCQSQQPRTHSGFCHPLILSQLEGRQGYVPSGGFFQG